MGNKELGDLLGQLHARLGAARSVDDEDRRRLTSALRDIENVLGTGASQPQPQPPPAHGLEAFAAKFEAEHPSLADGLRRLADALGKAGI